MILAALPVRGSAQAPPPGDHWVPAAHHREAVERAHRDLRLLGELVESAPPGDLWFRLQRIRILYFLSVEEAPRLLELDRELDALSPRPGPGEGPATLPVSEAYRAAGEVLRGKHALWPGTRNRHLRAGLAVLDSLVAAHPEHPEVRYLRLVSTAYLPFVFGRRGESRRDAEILVELLPRAAGSLPNPALVAMTDVLLEGGRLDPSRRTRVQEFRSAAVRETPPDPAAALHPPDPRSVERLRASLVRAADGGPPRP